jgi:hypothetical protein
VLLGKRVGWGKSGCAVCSAFDHPLFSLYSAATPCHLNAYPCALLTSPGCFETRDVTGCTTQASSFIRPVTRHRITSGTSGGASAGEASSHTRALLETHLSACTSELCKCHPICRRSQHCGSDTRSAQSFVLAGALYGDALSPKLEGVILMLLLLGKMDTPGQSFRLHKTSPLYQQGNNCLDDPHSALPPMYGLRSKYTTHSPQQMTGWALKNALRVSPACRWVVDSWLLLLLAYAEFRRNPSTDSNRDTSTRDEAEEAGVSQLPAPESSIGLKVDTVPSVENHTRPSQTARLCEDLAESETTEATAVATPAIQELGSSAKPISILDDLIIIDYNGGVPIDIDEADEGRDSGKIRLRWARRQLTNSLSRSIGRNSAYMTFSAIHGFRQIKMLFTLLKIGCKNLVQLLTGQRSTT